MPSPALLSSNSCDLSMMPSHDPSLMQSWSPLDVMLPLCNLIPSCPLSSLQCPLLSTMCSPLLSATQHTTGYPLQCNNQNGTMPLQCKQDTVPFTARMIPTTIPLQLQCLYNTSDTTSPLSISIPLSSHSTTWAMKRLPIPLIMSLSIPPLQSSSSLHSALFKNLYQKASAKEGSTMFYVGKSTQFQWSYKSCPSTIGYQCRRDLHDCWNGAWHSCSNVHSFNFHALLSCIEILCYLRQELHDRWNWAWHYIANWEDNLDAQRR